MRPRVSPPRLTLRSVSPTSIVFSKFIRKELSTATNIKDRLNRQSVIRLLTRIQENVNPVSYPRGVLVSTNTPRKYLKLLNPSYQVSCFTTHVATDLILTSFNHISRHTLELSSLSTETNASSTNIQSTFERRSISPLISSSDITRVDSLVYDLLGLPKNRVYTMSLMSLII